MKNGEGNSSLLFGVLITVVLIGIGYLGWRVYDSPVDPEGAEAVAVQATEVVVRSGGGDASVCDSMVDVSASDEADEVVQRCQEMAQTLSRGGMGRLGVQSLEASEVDIGRSSGEVTVSGRLLTPGGAFDLTFTWPVGREDDRWVVSDSPEVDVQ